MPRQLASNAGDFAKLVSLRFIIFVFAVAFALNKPNKIQEVRIGAILDAGDNEEELALRTAIESINNSSDFRTRARIVPHIVKIKGDDSFRAAKLVCSLLEKGVSAIFGPTYPSTSVLVQTTCKVIQVPHIDLNWSMRATKTNLTVNLYPHPGVLSQAIADLVKSQNWKSFTIIYEENEALIRLQELLKIQNVKEVKIALRQWRKNSEYKKLLKDVGKTGETNIILDIPTEKVPDVLREAQSVGMMTEYHNYLVTSLDLHTLNLQEFQLGRTNISGFRLVKKDIPLFSDKTRSWVSGEKKDGQPLGHKRPIKTSIAVLYDAVNTFASALHNMGLKQTIQSKQLSCENVTTWPYGVSLVSHMKNTKFEGITGPILMDSDGLRMDFVLDCVELKREGLTTVGTWDPANRINITRNYTSVYQEVIKSLRNRTLKVTTILMQITFSGSSVVRLLVLTI